MSEVRRRIFGGDRAPTDPTVEQCDGMIAAAEAELATAQAAYAAATQRYGQLLASEFLDGAAAPASRAAAEKAREDADREVRRITFTIEHLRKQRQSRTERDTAEAEERMRRETLDLAERYASALEALEQSIGGDRPALSVAAAYTTAESLRGALYGRLPERMRPYCEAILHASALRGGFDLALYVASNGALGNGLGLSVFVAREKPTLSAQGRTLHDTITHLLSEAAEPSVALAPAAMAASGDV